MSLTLQEIHDRLPNWVSSINPKALCVHNSSGFPIGYVYQDKTRSIYESYIWNDGTGMMSSNEFLSYFKHRFLLKIKDTPNYTRYIYVLQKIL